MMRIRLAYLLLAASLPIVIFAAVMVVLFDRQQTRSLEAVIHQAAEAALSTVDERITTVRIALETLIISGLPMVEWHQEFTHQADLILGQRPDWMALQLTWRGDRVIRTRDGFRIPAAPDQETDEVFRYGEFRISGILVDRARRHEPVIAVSVPVPGEGGIEHVLTAYVSAWAVNRAIRDQGITPGWRIAVLDTDNRLIARNLSEDSHDPGIGSEPDPSLLAGLRSGQPHFFATNWLSENLYVSSAVSATTGWTVALGMPGALVELPARRTLAAVIGGGTLAIGIAMGIGWLLARTLMKRQAAERRLLQLELAQAARERTSAILESTTDGVFEVDSNWRIVFINQRARALIAAGADVTGRILWDVLPEAVSTTFWSHYHRVATEGVPAEFEEFYPALNIWFYVRAFPSGDGGLAVYFQDVTERRRARDALAESELRYRFLAESVPEIVWTARPDGILDYANARLAEYFVDSQVDIAQSWNSGWSDLVHPEDSERILSSWHNAMATHAPYECEFRLKRPDGMYRWHMARGRPMLDETGQVVKWFGSTTDIHDKILYQETLQAARDDAERARSAAEQADLAKSKFLAAASHDLRQPMQSLFLFADGLEQHISDSEGSEKLLHLRRGLDVLKGLLDALLDISRLDAEAVEPTIEDLPLSLLFDPVEAVYARVAAAKGLNFFIAHHDMAVRSDRTLLARILGNLIENAIQYTATGTVRVECRAVGDLVRIEVQDTGIGIPPDQIDDIWTEFHQVGNPERDRNKGLGLGLAIVERLSRLLDCRVEVLSALGRGSIFSIDIPASKAVATAKQVPKPIASPVGGPVNCPVGSRYAVLVDDDAIVLLGLQSILRDWGYEVLAAGSTDQALERLRAAPRKPDIIVADYRLRSGRVGTEAIVKIRELFDSNIPGVILTGETGPECAADAAAHGFSIAHKPITSHQLNVAVEKLLSEAAD